MQALSLLGVFFNRFFEHSVILPTMAENETWSKSWIIMFMASFFVYAPIIGLFLARLGKAAPYVNSFS